MRWRRFAMALHHRERRPYAPLLRAPSPFSPALAASGSVGDLGLPGVRLRARRVVLLQRGGALRAPNGGRRGRIKYTTVLLPRGFNIACLGRTHAALYQYPTNNNTRDRPNRNGTIVVEPLWRPHQWPQTTHTAGPIAKEGIVEAPSVAHHNGDRHCGRVAGGLPVL